MVPKLEDISDTTNAFVYLILPHQCQLDSKKVKAGANGNNKARVYPLKRHFNLQIKKVNEITLVELLVSQKNLPFFIRKKMVNIRYQILQ